jgi:hypothetical protein
LANASAIINVASHSLRLNSGTFSEYNPIYPLASSTLWRKRDRF